MKFKIMGKEGDAGFEYDDPAMAEIKFDELRESMVPAVRENGKNRILKSFDPAVEEVVWLPKLIGG